MSKYFYDSVHERIRGFTIVELLIVIVVIGILAAITVVAFNSIQNKAKTASYASAIDAWEKLIKAEYEITGKLPTSLNPRRPETVCLEELQMIFRQRVDFPLVHVLLMKTALPLTITKRT